MNDTAATIAAAEAGMKRADAAASPEWKMFCREAIGKLAKTRETFTTDHVHEELESNGIATINGSAIGPMIRKAAKHGVIKNSGMTTRSQRPVSHGRITIVWQSLIYKPTNPTFAID